MTRPREYTEDFFVENISYAEIERQLNRYFGLSEAERRNFFTENNSSPSQSYFVVWRGKMIDAKVIGKAALREKGLAHKNWRNEIPRALERIGYLIWDATEDGELDRKSTPVYEMIWRLARPRHQKFRNDALDMWGNRCAVSGTMPNVALQAAHIVPHRDSGEMSLDNSIVLRADLHLLFDSGLMAVDPKTMRVSFSQDAREPYSALDGSIIKLPNGGPTPNNFQTRWNEFQRQALRFQNLSSAVQI